MLRCDKSSLESIIIDGLFTTGFEQKSSSGVVNIKNNLITFQSNFLSYIVLINFIDFYKNTSVFVCLYEKFVDR